MDKIRILHIDDHPQDRQVVRDVLEGGNEVYEVLAVENREMLQSNLQQGKVALILSDVNTSLFDGLQLLPFVKRTRPDIPVVIVTGAGSEEIVLLALKMGASDYVIKSDDCLRHLVKTVELVLENQRFEVERSQTLTALRESVEIYHSIYNNTSVAILLLSVKTGRILSANESACQLFKSTEQELRQLDKDGILDKKDSRLPGLLKHWKSNPKTKGELTFIKKGGKHFQAEFSSVNFLSREGERCSSMVIRDLTEKKMAEKKLITLSKVVEQSPTSILITDANGIIQFVNAKYTEVTQYSLEEVVGKQPRVFNRGHLSDSDYENMWATLRSGKVWTAEMQNRRKDHTTLIEHVTISPLLMSDGTIGNFIVMQEDFTEKKRILDDLIVAKEKAVENDRLKTAFLHNISHEIRTPMNAIIGFSGFLNEPDLPEEKRKQFTNVIVRSSEHLLSIITDIITIATVEAGQEKLNENDVNLNNLCRILFDQFILKAKEKHLTLDFHTFLMDNDSLIVSDHVKLSEVLSNLIGNAIKFTDNGRVDFGYELKGNHLEFFVKDTGIGIPVEMSDEIFKRFRQLEYTSKRKFGGSGLGLSICKSYIELMGGQIWLESQPGYGSTFYFTIPCRRKKFECPLEESMDGDLIPEYTTNRTILIAEDEDTNFILLTALLASFKWTIIRALDGAEAVEACRSNPAIELVLMDIKMPKIDGYEATRQIKSFAPDLPIIAQTAYISDEDKKKAMESGCCDFISKPIVKKQLITKIMDQLHL